MNCPRCDKPIDEHEAGRETDVCVAVVVMGWLDVKMSRDDYGGQPMPEERNEFGELLIWKPVPEYSAPDGIAAAWEVVERLRASRYVDIGVDEHGAQVQIDVLREGNWETGGSTRADTAPLAICRATLKAVSNE